MEVVIHNTDARSTSTPEVLWFDSALRPLSARGQCNGRHT